ncbi:MAG: GAF domain-containing protein [Chlorobi bacterium]|nr:GAF domain-containing protein [Chlorobiota bacterium]
MQTFNKNKKLFAFYIAILLILWIIQFVILIKNYTFSKLPVSISLVFLITLVIIYLLYQAHLQIISKINNSDKNNTFVASKTTPDDETQINSTSENLLLEKELLNGITKKTPQKKIAEKLLSNLIKNQQAEIGIFYIYHKKTKTYQAISSYAYLMEDKPPSFKEGEGLPGQVIKNKKALRISDVPENYFNIISGLGKAKPKNLLIYPIVLNKTVWGVIEMASFTDFSLTLEEELTKFFEANSDKILNIEDN